jgi:hypothetical protein
MPGFGLLGRWRGGLGIGRLQVRPGGWHFQQAGT